MSSLEGGQVRWLACIVPMVLLSMSLSSSVVSNLPADERVADIRRLEVEGWELGVGY